MSEYNSQLTEVENLEQALRLQADAQRCTLDAIELQRQAIQITKGVWETLRSMDPNFQVDEDIDARKDAFDG